MNRYGEVIVAVPSASEPLPRRSSRTRRDANSRYGSRCFVLLAAAAAAVVLRLDCHPPFANLMHSIITVDGLQFLVLVVCTGTVISLGMFDRLLPKLRYDRDLRSRRRIGRFGVLFSGRARL